MERFTSCKRAPSCQSAAVRLAWVTRIRKGSKGEEWRDPFNPATIMTGLRSQKKETKAINLSQAFVVAGSGAVGTGLVIPLVVCWSLVQTGSRLSRNMAAEICGQTIHLSVWWVILSCCAGCLCARFHPQMCHKVCVFVWCVQEICFEVKGTINWIFDNIWFDKQVLWHGSSQWLMSHAESFDSS